MTELASYLWEQARLCQRPPLGRFRHRWWAPMPPRGGVVNDWSVAERFASGDYAGGLFHHDLTESAIELVRDPELADACLGSLLCFLDTMLPNGCVHRIELPYRARDPEPAKPVLAQLALRCVDNMERGIERIDEHRVFPRLTRFLGYLERETIGRHGLPLTPSCRASGFDSDVLSAGFDDWAVEGPDTATFLVLEYEALSELARRLGQEAEALELARKAAALREAIETLLWYEPARTYIALRWRHAASNREDEIVGHHDVDGDFEPLSSWICLLPLYAGIPTNERAQACLTRLLDSEKYWGPHGIRTAPRDDVYFHQAARVMIYDPRRNERRPVSNWSGPIWILSNYYMFVALRRYGRFAEARELADRTFGLLEHDLETTGMLHECYDDEGVGLWPRRGTFVSWNILALTMKREAESCSR